MTKLTVPGPGATIRLGSAATWLFRVTVFVPTAMSVRYMGILILVLMIEELTVVISKLCFGVFMLLVALAVRAHAKSRMGDNR